MKAEGIVRIDRSRPLDLEKFLGADMFAQGCQIVDQDEQSLALTEVDLSKVLFEGMRQEKEFGMLSVRDITDRLVVARRIKLDAQFFRVFLEDPSLIPEWWRQCGPCGMTQHVYCYGTTFANRRGERFIVGWKWEGWTDGRWSVKPSGYPRLDDKGYINSPAVTIAGM